MCETKRLILRNWIDSDIQPFINMNRDPQVMEFFPNLYTKEESVAFINQMQKNITDGFGFYACVLKSDQSFIGFVGLNQVTFHASFTPCVEIGWRIGKEFWGQAFAAEAAQKCLEIGFNQFNLDKIVSFTSIINKKSERVMQKIGMVRDINQDFHHPKLPETHPLALHILYITYIKHNG